MFFFRSAMEGASKVGTAGADVLQKKGVLVAPDAMEGCAGGQGGADAGAMPDLDEKDIVADDVTPVQQPFDEVALTSNPLA